MGEGERGGCVEEGAVAELSANARPASGHPFTVPSRAPLSRPVLDAEPVNEVTEKRAQQGRELLLILLGETGEQRLLMRQQLVDRTFDDRVAGGGELDKHRSPIGSGPQSAYPAVTLGPGDALRHRARADQYVPGDLTGGKAVRRACPPQRGQQIPSGRIDAQQCVCTAPLILQQLGDAPDPGDDTDRAHRCAGTLAEPGLLDAVDTVGCARRRVGVRVKHNNTLDLKEICMRQVIVTGGGTGIGRAVAAAFRDAGDAVTITGRRADVLERTAKELDVVAVSFDAAEPDAVLAALDDLPPHVDVLVNNAGGNTDLDRSEPDDLAALAANWRANFSANVLSAVLVTGALTPRIVDHGRIVTIGSIAARLGAGAYGAAKAAIEAWTITVATEFGPRGITANVVAPGLVLDTEFFRGRLDESGIKQRIAATRNKRAGRVEDVAATVRFLASPKAGHITGQVIHVNGGAYLGR